MELLDLLKYFLVPCLLCYIGYNEKDKFSMKNKVEKTIEKDDIEKLIDLKMVVHQVEISGIKEDLRRIESKLDKLLDNLNKH